MILENGTAATPRNPVVTVNLPGRRPSVVAVDLRATDEMETRSHLRRRLARRRPTALCAQVSSREGSPTPARCRVDPASEIEICSAECVKF
jgi:hypothetical protein